MKKNSILLGNNSLNNGFKLAVLICIFVLFGLQAALAEGDEISTENGTSTDDETSIDNEYVDKTPSESLNPTLLGISSFFVPGVGQAFNQEYGKGAGMLSLYAAILYGQSELQKKEDYNSSAPFFGTDLITYRTKTMQSYFTLQTFELELRFYSAFDAFRDARRINEAHGVVYLQKTSNETATELWLAPFNYKNFEDPLVFLPLAFVAVMVGSEYNYDPFKDEEKYKKDKNKEHGYYVTPTNPKDYDYMVATSAAGTLAVGVGEETFFRGYLFPASTELTGSTFYGGVMESALFGLAHGGTGAQASPVMAFLMGSYFSYISYQHDFALGPGIALHSWWDTLLTLDAIKRNKGKTKFDKKGNPIKETYSVLNLGFTF